MRKRHLVSTVFIFSVIFIIFQLRLFWKFPKTEQKDGLLENSFGEGYVSIQAFVEVCHVHGFPVFIIDPVLLKSVMTNKTLGPSCDGPCPVGCRYLCAKYSVITFGVIDQLWRPQEALQDFIGKGFVVSNFSQISAPGFKNSTSIPTHYIFQYHSQLIHLVIFYQRQNDLFWHGRLTTKPNETGLHFDKNVLHFGNEEGAYSSLNMAKVKMDELRLRAPSYPLAFLRQMSESRFIECNWLQRDKFHDKYGKPDLTAKARHFYDSARTVLSLAKQALDEIGLRFWISSGTCLGWFRQCDLIPYSKDVDIGIWIKDYDVRLTPSLQAAGLELLHVFGKVNDSFELSFSSGDVKLDIFFFYEETDYMWNGGTQARTGKKFKYVFPKFQLCWTLFLDLRVRVPCETLAYVEANYGKNWFEPVKTWDWKKSPPNVHENGVWSEMERPKVIQLYG